ncbi:phospholipase D family protein [Leucobacter albus]|uniref:Phospholipase D family protein n=1 Tax=Leucobacter albus TaxID=272210 RepID=A0ABW3TSD1_9MICO
MLQIHMPGTLGGNLLEHLLVESIGAVRGGGVFAWTNAGGASLFLEDPVMAEMLANAKFSLLVGTDAITDTTAIEKLQAFEARWPNLCVQAFLSPERSLFHPKFAWFEHDDHVSFIVGSGNLTVGGLLSNWEASYVVRVALEDAEPSIAAIDSFMSSYEASIFPMSDANVLDRVAQNKGNERNLRGQSRLRGGSGSAAAVDEENTVLIAEIPAAGTRWQQANFDKQNYEGFFGAKVGSQRRVVLQNVRPSGELAPAESRPSVEVASQNYRFELAAAAGVPYPTEGPPIGVFVKLDTGQFLYSLIVPGEDGYEEISQFLDVTWNGNARMKRRVTSTVRDFKTQWPGCPIWNAALPDL